MHVFVALSAYISHDLLVRKHMKTSTSNVAEASQNQTEKNKIVLSNMPVTHTPMAKIEAELFNDQALGERYALMDKNLDADDKEQDIAAWFEQRFLSHKIRADQKLEEIALEFLITIWPQDYQNLHDNVDDNGCAFFLRPHQSKLRYIIFSNPFQNYFDSMSGLQDSEKWTKWKESIVESSWISKKKGIHIIEGEDVDRLQDSFAGDFSDFTKAVTLLRLGILGETDRKWSTQYIFPFGPDCLFIEMNDDLTFKNNNLSGVGQLMFSMMQRSKYHDKCSQICKSLQDSFLNPNNMMNTLAQLIEGHSAQSFVAEFQNDCKASLCKELKLYGDKKEDGSFGIDTYTVARTAYLPYKYHPVFDMFTLDLSNLVSMPRHLNQSDLFNALGIVCTLNINIYYLEMCCRILEYSGESANIDIVVVCNQSDQNLKKLSVSRAKDNDALFKHTMHQLFIRITQQLYSQYQNDSLIGVKECVCIAKFLQSTFKLTDAFNKFSNEDSEFYTALAPKQKTFGFFCESLADTFISCRSHILGAHGNFCKTIGLMSKSHVYYKLPDSVVRVLIMTTISQDEQLMPFDVFIKKLYQKYHLIIGSKEDKTVNSIQLRPNNTQYSFNTDENIKAFKNQLSRLGFLITLSDTESYVKNPYLL